MRQNQDIMRLASQMSRQLEDDTEERFLLFLGQGCARAAGVPKPATIAHDVIHSLSHLDSKWVEQHLPDWEQASNEELVWAFNTLLGQMSPARRYSILDPHYRRIPVPAFYQDLAILVKTGYFDRVLTTNIDNLFEQALNGVGLRIGSDYEVISLISPQDSQKSWHSGSRFGNLLRIIKLYGDVGQSETILTPQEIEQVLESQSSIKSSLKSHTIMVGYEFESEAINRWLTFVPGGELWWVNSSDPDRTQTEPIEYVRNFTTVTGETGNPQTFFSQLVQLLLRQPLQLGNISLSGDYSPDSPSYSSAGDATMAETSLGDDYPEGTSPGDEELDAEYLHDQLRRYLSTLYSLEQTVIPGEINPQLQTQIEYQKRLVFEVEDQLRELSRRSAPTPPVMDLLGKIAESVINSSADPDTTSFLQEQASTIEREYSRDEPNQHIVSGAIGATVVVAERLGPEVVKPELVRALAAFAPSVAGRTLSAI